MLYITIVGVEKLSDDELEELLLYSSLVYTLLSIKLYVELALELSRVLLCYLGEGGNCIAVFLSN